MRWKTFGLILAFFVSLAGTGIMPAAAFDLHRSKPPAGWGKEQVVKHHVYYPRYHHVYHVHSATDPYAYRSEARGYYPYYNSGYWRPAAEVRHARPRYVLPKYYPAWGYTRHWHHKQWHAEHHGRHRPWHW